MSNTFRIPTSHIQIIKLQQRLASSIATDIKCSHRKKMVQGVTISSLVAICFFSNPLCQVSFFWLFLRDIIKKKLPCKPKDILINVSIFVQKFR